MKERITEKLPKRSIETVAGLVLMVAAAACAGGEGKEGVLGVGTPSASPERPVPTKTAESTVVPTPTATVRPTSTREVPRTPTPEAPKSKEGILDLGNWQIAIQSWEEIPALTPTGGKPVPREGWKRVLIRGTARNKINSPVLNPRQSLTDYSRERQFEFLIRSVDGFDYKASVGSQTLSEPGFFLTGIVDEGVPPGFGVPIGIIAEVPEIKNDYSLIINKISREAKVGQIGQIKKGDKVDNFPQIVPEAKIKSLSEPWVIPGYATISFNKVFTIDVRYLNYLKAQYISFEIQNNYGQDIDINYGAHSILVFLGDGQVIAGRGGDYGSTNGFPEKPSQPEKIAPGLAKRVDLNVTVTSRQAGYISGEIYELSGATVVLFFNNQWSAWRVE